MTKSVGLDIINVINKVIFKINLNNIENVTNNVYTKSTYSIFGNKIMRNVVICTGTDCFMSVAPHYTVSFSQGSGVGDITGKSYNDVKSAGIIIERNN